jgi:hypothetical protein
LGKVTISISDIFKPNRHCYGWRVMLYDHLKVDGFDVRYPEERDIRESPLDVFFSQGKKGTISPISSAEKDFTLEINFPEGIEGIIFKDSTLSLLSGLVDANEKLLTFSTEWLAELLTNAISANKIENAEILLEAGASPNIPGSSSNLTPTQHLCSPWVVCTKEIVTLLHKYGASFDGTMEFMDTKVNLAEGIRTKLGDDAKKVAHILPNPLPEPKIKTII